MPRVPRCYGYRRPAWTISSSSTDTGHYIKARRTWCTGSQGQRGFQLHEGKQRPSRCQPPGTEGQTLLPTASWYQLPRKTLDNAAVSETALSLREKEHREQNLLQQRGWVLAAAKASRCPGSDAGDLAHARPAVRGLWPHSCGIWNTEAEGIQYRLKQNKETLIESETGKENPT